MKESIENTIRQLAKSPEDQDFLVETIAKNCLEFPESEIHGNFGRRDVGTFVQLKNLLGNFNGKNILDVGCGAIKSGDGPSFTPDLARLLSFTGGNIFGIDIGQSPNEPYTHLVANLNYQKIGNIVPTGIKFDAVISLDFFDSPEFINGNSYSSRLELDICRQIRNSLKDEGRFFTDDRILNKAIISSAGFRLDEPMPRIIVPKTNGGFKEVYVGSSIFNKSDYALQN